SAAIRREHTRVSRLREVSSATVRLKNSLIADGITNRRRSIRRHGQSAQPAVGPRPTTPQGTELITPADRRCKRPAEGDRKPRRGELSICRWREAARHSEAICLCQLERPELGNVAGVNA